MKLKRPSGANEYDTLADIEGESQLVFSMLTISPSRADIILVTPWYASLAHSAGA
jgi:hypothetical protein